MDIGTIVVLILAAAMVVIAYFRGGEVAAAGWRGTFRALQDFLPLFIGIFVLIGFSEVLIPREIIARWLGPGAGLRGIMIASGVGMLIPGGPFVSFPLIAMLHRAGAGVGAVVAFLTAWSLWSLTRLPLEFAILGPRLMAARLISTLFMPPLAGWIAYRLFDR
ncbi:permease [Thermoflexus sp.]|uniref:permease n=1 Tax=Thermoflexus sp. TaxID=1969742 RepID=UPI002ADDCD45|nr:permease [Thermoflexus sp.]